MKNKVIIKRIYRHFKGNYYYINDIVLDSENLENMVIYTALYQDKKTYVRKETLFFDEVSNRSDNITKQKYRFEIIDMESENKC